MRQKPCNHFVRVESLGVGKDRIYDVSIGCPEHTPEGKHFVTLAEPEVDSWLAEGALLSAIGVVPVSIFEKIQNALADAGSPSAERNRRLN